MVGSALQLAGTVEAETVTSVKWMQPVVSAGLADFSSFVWGSKAPYNTLFKLPRSLCASYDGTVHRFWCQSPGQATLVIERRPG